jgi:two-component system, LytTR family, response regulator
MDAMNMKAVIVDDERLAREELRTLLAEHEFVQVCAEAASARAALELVRDEKPDLLFLDVEMPGMNGFDFLEALPAPHPHVIFVTAYDAFAVRAFEVNALDYLMKPVHPQRLAAALAKVRAKQDAMNDGGPGGSDAAPQEERPFKEDDRIFVKDGDRCWFIPIGELRLLETDGNFTRLHLKNEKPLLYRTLNSLEERLPPSMFIRANRSQIVNMRHIKDMHPWFSGGVKAVLNDGTEVEFSRRQTRALRAQTGL